MDSKITMPITNSTLQRLLAVADLDSELVTLRHRLTTLPERDALTQLDANLSALKAPRDEIAKQRDEALFRQREAEAEASAIEERRRGIESKLLAARGTPARELQAMNDEIGHLRERQEEFEEVALSVMEEVEPLTQAIEEFEKQGNVLLGQRPDLVSSLESAEVEVKAQIEDRSSRREGALVGIDEDLLESYARVGARFGGVGAARLVGARCGGCHLELPSMEVERVRRLPEGEVANCDSCGRILIVAAPQASGE